MNSFLDIFFLSSHTLLIFFNLFGWIPKATRRANLITLILTGTSWFLLGIFYGIGYCPLTDWHWEVLYMIGETDLPNSYIKYLFDRLFGLVIPANMADILTGLFYFISLAISIYLNVRFRRTRDYSKRRRY